MKKILGSVLVLFIVVLISGCNKQEESVDQNQNIDEQISQSQETQEPKKTLYTGNEIDTTNWQTYQNEEYGFKLKYPSDWELKTESSVNKEKIQDSFYFIKSKTREEKIYFAILTNGGFGYGTPEMTVTEDNFKNKEAEFSWYGSSDLPTFIKIKNELPNNWSLDNRIEIINWNNSDKEEKLLKEIYDSFMFF